MSFDCCIRLMLLIPQSRLGIYEAFARRLRRLTVAMLHLCTRGQKPPRGRPPSLYHRGNPPWVQTVEFCETSLLGDHVPTAHDPDKQNHWLKLIFNGGAF